MNGWFKWISLSLICLIAVMLGLNYKSEPPLKDVPSKEIIRLQYLYKNYSETFSNDFIGQIEGGRSFESIIINLDENRLLSGVGAMSTENDIATLKDKTLPDVYRLIINGNLSAGRKSTALLFARGIENLWSLSREKKISKASYLHYIYLLEWDCFRAASLLHVSIEKKRGVHGDLDEAIAQLRTEGWVIDADDISIYNAMRK